MTYEAMREALVRLASDLPRANHDLAHYRARGQEPDHRIEPLSPTAPSQGEAAIEGFQRAARRLEIPVRFVPLMKYRIALGVSMYDGAIKLRKTDASEYPHVAHVFAHELTHNLWHRTPQVKDQRVEEAEAECVAHLVSTHFRIAGAMDSALYLANFGVTAAGIEKIATRVIAYARFLIDMTQEEKNGGHD